MKFGPSYHLLCVLCIILLINCEQGSGYNPSNNPVYVPVYHQENDKGDKVTILTFYIQQQAEQAEDYLQINFQIKTKDGNSLKKAINQAETIIQKVKKSVIQICNKHSGQNCEERLDIGNHQIVAEYQRVRREQQFKSFVVTYEVTLIVKQSGTVGQMLDQIMSLGIYKINSFQWKPFEQVNVQQIAINNGIAQGKDLCEKINRKIGEILAIEQVYSFSDDEGGQQQDEQEQGGQDEQNPSILKFQVECIGRTTQMSQVQSEKLQEQNTEQNQSKKEKKKKKKKQEKQQ